MPQKRINLFDPILYQSSYINPNPTKATKLHFWKRLNIYTVVFNIIIPIGALLLFLFFLKSRYNSNKIREKHPDNDGYVADGGGYVADGGGYVADEGDGSYDDDDDSYDDDDDEMSLNETLEWLDTV